MARRPAAGILATLALLGAASCGAGDPMAPRRDAASVAPGASPEDALRAAAQAQADASVAGDAVRLASFPSPRCTEEERLGLAAAAALPPEVVAGGRIVVDLVRVNGAFGSVTYAFGGQAPAGFREAFEAVDDAVDYWELIDGTWHTVDPKACAGDAKAARAPATPASTPSTPSAPAEPPPVDAAFAAAWKLESLEVHEEAGTFAGTAVVSHDPDVRDADFTFTLFQGSDRVGTLRGTLRDADEAGPANVDLISDDAFVAGNLGYDFRPTAPG